MLRLSWFLFLTTSVWCGEPRRIVLGRTTFGESLHISKADGSEERLLQPPNGLDYDPAWSPDGQWITFTSDRNGSADLYRVKPDGSGLERLTDNPAYDDQAAYSPDGSQLAFVTTRAGGTADLWILDLRTHKQRPLTSGPGGDFRPAWSPDGKWIAFSSDRGGNLPTAKGHFAHLQPLDIYIVRPDGSGLKRITPHGGYCGSPKWTRDSARVLAYCMTAEETWPMRSGPPFGPGSRTRLVSLDVASGAMAEVAENLAASVKISPVPLASGEVGYINVAVQEQAGIFYSSGKRGPSGGIVSAAWSPDETRVAYAKIEISTPDRLWTKLWSRDHHYELVSTEDWFPAFDPAGKRFAALHAGGPGPPSFELFETATHATRRLFQEKDRIALSASWSPAGDPILLELADYGLYDTGLRSKSQVAVMHADGSGLREVTGGANNNSNPYFAPDGKRFVYRTSGPEGQGLRIKNLETNAMTTLTTEYDTFPAWSPRGDLIVFTRKVEGDYEIYTIRPDGTDVRRLTNSPGNDGHPAWSPDGRWIAFASARMGFKDEVMYTYAPQPYGEVFVMRSDGTHVKQLTDNQWEDGGPAWQPEARSADSRSGR